MENNLNKLIENYEININFETIIPFIIANTDKHNSITLLELLKNDEGFDIDIFKEYGSLEAMNILYKNIGEIFKGDMNTGIKL